MKDKLSVFFKWLVVINVSLFFFSCKHNNEKYPGFTKTSSGLYYKLQAFGDSKQKPSKEEYLKLSITYKTGNDSVFYSTKDQNPTGVVVLSAVDLTSKGLLGAGILNMNGDDSVTFIIDANNLFDNFFHAPLPLFLNKNSMVKADVKLNSILNKNEYEAELKKYEETVAAWDVEEQRRIQQYIKTNNLNALQQPDGMYYIPVLEGTGLPADSGRTVMINYSGYFLDSRKFDSSGDKVPFEFTIGDEYQVIWGLQQGIKLMKAGGKAKFIIPSYLAFGELGSSTGMVPPNTTVVYEVELINVK